MKPRFTHLRTLYSGKEGVTPGKLYRIMNLDSYVEKRGYHFQIVDDEGRLMFCRSKKCLYLNSEGDWELVNTFEENLKRILE